LISGTDYDFELRSIGDGEVQSIDFADLEEITRKIVFYDIVETR